MKPPGFWNDPRPTAMALLLTPLSAFWRFGAEIRSLAGRRTRVDIPVICIGNASLGGAGKTPVAINLATAMTERGLQPHILTRGYGGTETGPVLVDPDRHDASQVGDEPLLLARAAPTWVARDRGAGARAAEAAGATHIIMDDGYQNPNLHQDVRILVVDAGVGFGNGLVFPAGPLREPADAALARAHIVVSLGDGDPIPAPTGAVAARARVEATLPKAIDPDRPCLAFAGIARPEKFFATARAMGLALVKTRDFPDHYRYDASDLQSLSEEAKSMSAQLITTEKDLVRLPRTRGANIHALPIRLVWDDRPLIDVVQKRLSP